MSFILMFDTPDLGVFSITSITMAFVLASIVTVMPVLLVSLLIEPINASFCSSVALDMSGNS